MTVNGTRQGEEINAPDLTSLIVKLIPVA